MPYIQAEVKKRRYNENNRIRRQIFRRSKRSTSRTKEYILSIDEDNLDQLHPEYRDKMAILNLEEVKK